MPAHAGIHDSYGASAVKRYFADAGDFFAHPANSFAHLINPSWCDHRCKRVRQSDLSTWLG
jgi:hypothetical protein